MPTSSFRDTVRGRLLHDMIESVKTSWKVMLVDQLSMRVLSAACRMYDIMESGITLVDKIDNPRQSLPHLEAVYFLTPTEESVNLLLEDFRDKKHPKYAAAHVFFTYRLPNALLSKFKGEPIVEKMRTLKDLYLEFLAVEGQVWTCDRPESLHNLFSPTSTLAQQEHEHVSNQLVSLFATMGDYPIIRYNQKHHVAGRLAGMVQDKLDDLCRAVANFPPASERERATLLVLDRSVDPLSPLMHEFTYQAMCYDVLGIEKDTYKYKYVNNAGQKLEKEVLLNETDPLWPTLRHMHIADTISYVIDNFNAFVKANSKNKEVDSLKDLAGAIRQMPQYQETLSKYSAHIDMAQECMQVFTKERLDALASLEQDMACGQDADGQKTKNIMSQLAPLLSDDTVLMVNKIRLLMIYIMSQEGIKDADRKTLMEVAGVTFEWQNAIANMFYLGVSLSKGPSKLFSKGSKDKGKDKRRKDDVSYALSRYQPLLYTIVEGEIANELDATEFPYVKEPPPEVKKAAEKTSYFNFGAKKAGGSARANVPKWSQKPSKVDEEQPWVGGRLYVFIAGGITYSEMRAIYELSKAHRREIIIGGTDILTPRKFVDALKTLKPMETAESL